MQVSASIGISRQKEAVWSSITNIEQSSEMISSILGITVLEKPGNGIVGLKWRETRKIFGKEATEVMWITDAVENEYYCTRAESHGSVYVGRLSLEESNGATVLTMSFAGEPQTLVAKLLAALMNRFIKRSLQTELERDLEDIKHFVERSRQGDATGQNPTPNPGRV